MPSPLRICIVAEHASYRFGGEAVLPLHYFTRLRARNIEAWLVVHERTHGELEGLFPGDIDRMRFIPDRWFHRFLYHASLLLPRRISENTIGLFSQLLTQAAARRIAMGLVRSQRIDVIHQPIPVSPRFPSLLARMGAPVVIGPMNGGMDYPPAFKGSESTLSRMSIRFGRQFANIVNNLLPGKKLARVLLVANERTRIALPACVTGKVIDLAENGVDFKLWSTRRGDPVEASTAPTSARFIFVGRLVDWKRIDILIDALALVPDAVLEIVGDGSMQSALDEQARSLGVESRIAWSGWLPQTECAARIQSSIALLLPSIYECGGAVVLETMATGAPVIATRWGGPADYLDASCGILVEPSSREEMVSGFAQGMQALIDSPELRRKLGDAGKQRVARDYDWEKKVDRMIEIYESVATT